MDKYYISIINEKKKSIFDTKKELKNLEKDLKKIINEFQYNCKHDYVREKISTGPYQEYAYVCRICNKMG